MIRTVIFDLDGTVADTSPDLAAALNHVLLGLGRGALPVEQVRGMIGHGTRALLRQGLAATGGDDEELVETSYPVLMRFYEDHICDKTQRAPGVERAFDALSAQGVALGLCTNKPGRVTALLLEALGWSRRFAAVVAGDTLSVTKPDPAPLLHAIAEAGGGPALYVGDSITDVQTARAASVSCAVVSFGFPDRPPRELGADYVLDDYDELEALVRAL